MIKDTYRKSAYQLAGGDREMRREMPCLLYDGDVDLAEGGEIVCSKDRGRRPASDMWILGIRPLQLSTAF